MYINAASEKRLVDYYIILYDFDDGVNLNDLIM